MSKGKFNDFGWHTEFKSARKKSYQETCIFLNDIRECQNKNSYNYLSKCFDATHCPLKLKKRTRNNSQTIIKAEKESRKRSIVLYNKLDKDIIELFMNNMPYEKLPELHKVAFLHRINDEFVFADCHYKVIKIFDNRVYDESFRIIDENDNILKLINNTLEEIKK